MKTINLSVFYPLSTGLAYVFVCLASYLILKEAITWKQFEWLMDGLDIEQPKAIKVDASLQKSG